MKLDHSVLSDHSYPSRDKVPDLRPSQLQDTQVADEAAEIERATTVARAKCPEVAPLPGGNLDDDPEHIPTEFEETDDDETYITGCIGDNIQDRQEMPMNPEEERMGGDFEGEPSLFLMHLYIKMVAALSSIEDCANITTNSLPHNGTLSLECSFLSFMPHCPLLVAGQAPL